MNPIRPARLPVATLLLAVGACAGPPLAEPGASAALPAAAEDAASRIALSPRHAEWHSVDIGDGDTVRVWMVHPERADAAPPVLVVHEIFGLTPWIRAVADQLAADGFLAVAPDLLSGHGVAGGPEGPEPEAARAAIRELRQVDVQRRLDGVARWAMTLPSAAPRYGIVGFCWGGTVAFDHAALAAQPARLGGSVVFYGTSPAEPLLAQVGAPVLGLYGEDDARVNATIAPAQAALHARGAAFEHEIYPGAGHGFLRQQAGREGANLAASRAAWPRAVAFLRHSLGEGR
jgi:carboxymethylenebutenolidase